MLIILVVLLLMIALFAGCSIFKGLKGEEKPEQTPGPPGNLIELSYIYGDFRYHRFECNIKKITDEQGIERVFLKAEDFAYGDIVIEEEVEETVLNDLAKIIEEENIFAWNGFNKNADANDVRDGFSFELRAEFENYKIIARGYVKRPDNFKAGHDRLFGYLQNLVERYR